MSLLDAVNLANNTNYAPEKKKKKTSTKSSSSSSPLLKAVQQARGEESASSSAKISGPAATKTTEKTEDGNIFQKVFSAMKGVGSAVTGLFKPKTVTEPIKLQSGLKLNLVDAPTLNPQQGADANALGISGKPKSNLSSLQDKGFKIEGPGITQQDIDKQKAEQDKLINPFKTGVPLVDLAPATMNLLADLQVDPLSLNKTPKMTLLDAFKPFSNPMLDQANATWIKGIKDAIDADSDSIKRIFSAKSRSERSGAILESGARTVGVALSPITALFTAANEIPVLGTVSRLISLPFAVLGDAGADLAYPISNALPVDKRAKENIVGGIGEIVGLALMIGAGGKINSVPGKVRDSLTKKYGETDAATIVKEAESLANKPQEGALSGLKSPEEVNDIIFKTGIEKTPDGQTLLQAAREAQATGKYLEIESPKVAGLLEAENPRSGQITGEGFTMTEKANKQQVEVGKVINNYREAVEAYNKNPTTRSLERVQKARQNLANLEKEELVKVEVPVKGPTTINGVEIKPVGEEIKVYRGTQKGETGLNAEKPNGITGGESTSTNRAIAQAFAERKGGIVEEYKIPKSAKIVNHSDLERLVKYVPAAEKPAAVRKFLADNKVDVVKFDVPEGVKGEAEFRVINTKIFDAIEKKEVQVARDQMPVGKGPEQVSKLEARMKGIIGKATDEQIEAFGLSTYKKMNRRDTINDAAKYALENPEQALEVLSGKREAPKDIPPEAIYVALTEISRGDLTLATKLTSLQATSIGQRLSLLAELDPLNPVNIVNDIYKFRAKEFERIHAGKKLDEVIKRDMEKGKAKIKPPKMDDWSKFIEEVRC